MRNVRRQQVQQNKKRRNLIFVTFGILILIYLSMNLIIGENGLLRYIQLKSTKNQFHAETIAISNQTSDVKKQVDILKEKPHAFEEYAREYGLTNEGELIFKFEEKE